jgi:hypothetical protein
MVLDAIRGGQSTHAARVAAGCAGRGQYQAGAITQTSLRLMGYPTSGRTFQIATEVICIPG